MKNNDQKFYKIELAIFLFPGEQFLVFFSEWLKRSSPCSQRRPRGCRQRTFVTRSKNRRGHQEGQHCLAHRITRRTGLLAFF